MKKKFVTGLLLTAGAAAALAGCGRPAEKDSKPKGISYEYGVFLGEEAEDIGKMEPYRIIVLDAQYFTKEQINSLKDSGHTVYSYINIGSVENFRPYYSKYEQLTIGDYENWDEERWVDVSSAEWQSFVLDELAPSILEKGVEGFFVDNCDVYYNFPSEEIFESTAFLLKGLKDKGAYVSINGGDAFVTEYAKKFGELDSVMDAVNQETVFSRIDWDGDKFSANTDSEREYFQGYAEMVSGYGKDVYLLEYTTDEKLIDGISDYCKEKGFTYYASETLELLIPKSSRGSQPKK